MYDKDGTKGLITLGNDAIISLRLLGSDGIMQMYSYVPTKKDGASVMRRQRDYVLERALFEGGVLGRGVVPANEAFENIVELYKDGQKFRQEMNELTGEDNTIVGLDEASRLARMIRGGELAGCKHYGGELTKLSLCRKRSDNEGSQPLYAAWAAAELERVAAGFQQHFSGPRDLTTQVEFPGGVQAEGRVIVSAVTAGDTPATLAATTTFTMLASSVAAWQKRAWVPDDMYNVTYKTTLLAVGNKVVFNHDLHIVGNDGHVAYDRHFSYDKADVDEVNIFRRILYAPG